MEIKIKKTIEDTIEITLPKFWKKIDIGETSLLGAIDENNVIRFSRSSTRWMVSSFSAWVIENDIFTAYSEWEEVPEAKWFELYEKEMSLLTMQPVTDGTH